MTVNSHVKMVGSESQEEIERRRKTEFTLSGCTGARHADRDKQCVSPEAARKVMPCEESVCRDHSAEEHSDENNQRKENTLNGIPPTQDSEEEEHHHLGGISCKVEERDESAAHEDQREEGVVRSALSRQGTSEGEPTLRPSVSADMLAKSLQSKESPDGGHKKPSYIAQVAVPLLLAWVMMTSYTGMNFPGIALPQLTNPDTDDVYLEPHTVALFVSTIHVGTVAGSLVSGHLLVHLGRRTTILIGLPLGAAAWLGLVFFSHVWILMLCRVLTGCSFALVKQPTVMYMVEVAHESLRGRLVGLLCIAKEIGLFSSYVLGSLMLTWRQICIIYACIMVPPMIGIYFLPSSPRWLTTRGRVNEAHKSLVFFRGRRGNVDAELQEVVRQAEDAGGANKGTWQQLRLLTKPGTLRTFLLILSIMLLYPLQGSMLVYPYLAVILDTPGAPINLALSSVLCSTCKIFGTIVHLITVDYFGRVPIIAVGNSFISICTAAYGYFHLLGDNTDGISWLPMASISALMFLTGTVSPLMDVLQGELIPNACRAVTIPILSCLNGMVGFAAVQMFPYLTDILGMHAMFGLFTVFNLIAALIGVTAVPETRGLTLEAINDLVGSSKGHKSPRCQRRAVAGPNTAEECIKTSQSV